MRRLINFWDQTSFYLHRKVYYVLYAAAGIFVVSFFFPWLQIIARFLILALVILVLADSFLLYRKKGITASRLLPDRLSNGDENKIVLLLGNHYSHTIRVEIIEELPFQLNPANQTFYLELESRSQTEQAYWVKPVERGVYEFGRINIFAEGPLRMARRRYIAGAPQSVKVYPSYLQMRKYQLNALANRSVESGVKRLRRLGHSLEFEQIKEYVRGDDYRTINWKASARRPELMVNNFTDERSQQIYCLVNKGRMMKMAFEGMTLLDYAINSALVLSNIALQKQDKAGLVTFGRQVDSFIQADKKPVQMNTILEALYKQQTNFLEPDMEKLFSIVRNRITHRSLLVMFTNFESIESLLRVLPSLRKLAHYHLLLVVFFENTEVKQLVEKKAASVEDIYIKTIAARHVYEKQMMVKELQKNGIVALLSTPQRLTVDTINKYLEIKTRQSI